MSIKVSIALATYNGDQYLHAQLQSFISQTRLPDELIVSDDCSTDETVSIIKKFAETAPFPVKLLHNEENLGYCGNFNAALMKTTGDLVFLSDQDDVWFPEKVAHMVRFAERNREALLVMNDALLTDCDLDSLELTKIGQIRSVGLDMEHFVMGCCCAIRRELLDMCMPIPSGFKAHDGWLAWFADGLNAKVVEEQVLQYYRRHESNESQFVANSATKITRFDGFVHSVKGIMFDKAYRQRGDDQVEQVRLFSVGVRDATTSASRRYQSQLCKLLAVTDVRLGTLSQRKEIRQRPFATRFVDSSRLFFQGGYRHARGLKSALRDLFG